MQRQTWQNDKGGGLEGGSTKGLRGADIAQYGSAHHAWGLSGGEVVVEGSVSNNIMKLLTLKNNVYRV